ncbi:flagellar motor switch protein FliM [Methylopila capsulata]|uniref:Flagellar motor switch protein FliM n=1 Tax=Methylopila capsulata TaxID=61654 RepID=A0A9W6MQC3_9HYPH|nr:flagellar motor switch protein FliM [Methylopila capsulata]MBM7851060.1 flagellar motor switch protein FliM [Methylopila capsulata]GLK54118.1 flagellar motor switch protein FliM [Methylopila capsulata]
MAGEDDDDLAAEWGAAMAEQVGEDAEAMAAEWAAMLGGPAAVDDGGRKSPDRVLNQEEVDGLLGFNPHELGLNSQSGIRAIINSALVSYERLPMLEIVFDRLVRLLTTSLRNFTSDNVEVSLDGIRSVRFGDYLNSIPLPAILSVFKAHQWDGFGLMTVDSALIYSIIDVLLGGRRGAATMKVEGRPYTTIETSLVQRMIEVVLADAEQAFRPITNVNFSLDRLETNPRFAAITRPANAAILVNLRIDMEDRGGFIEVLLPYATIEPIRETLLQQFMGEKFGRDATWEGHLATEIWSAEAELHAVLYDKKLPLRTILDLDIGDTLMLDVAPDELVEIRCGDQVLTEARMGRAGDKVAVQIARPLRRSHTTLAAFEAAGESRKDA